MSGQGPTYDDCKAALATLSPNVLGVVPDVSGTGIQGTEPATFRVVVYVNKGTKQSLLTGGAIPASVQVGSDTGPVAVPVVIEEQDALAP